ncbi:MAG: amino acid adenylation domain-containing protein, partial [bacterium]|nr:amino acid adenylation domain-containing protein [bacterium]
ITSRDTVIQQASASFDAFVEEVYPVLLRGGKLVIVDRDIIPDIEALTAFMFRHNVSMISCSPLLLNELNRYAKESRGKTVHPLSSVRIFISGGDVLKPGYVDHLREWSAVYNTYGPTETTVCVTYFRLDSMESSTVIPIGKPISNYSVYILDQYRRLSPIGVAGELCVTGAGVTRGYLNRPELTSEKFCRGAAPSLSTPLYRTGDLARWFPPAGGASKGTIEFLGRIDRQVKLRGFRIELGEIESRLLKYPGLEEAVVIDRERDGDKYLCAYFVSEEDIGISELRDALSHDLPAYMIPSYFIPLERVPLTVGGKVDRKALPEPEAPSGGEYIAPTDELEDTLAAIWSDVLGIEKEKISIAGNFFQMGGHSLKATSMVAGIHKVFDIKVPLTEIFRLPSIRQLARYIREAEKEKYSAIVPVEEKEYYMLSSAQMRLYILQQMEPQSTAYNLPLAIPLDEAMPKEKLLGIFMQLIRRHESLRTSFIMVGEEPVQRIHKDVPFHIEYYDSAAEGTEETDHIGGLHRGVMPFDLSVAPLLRVGLVKLAEAKYLFMMDRHHIITDGISQEILEKEFLALYNGESLEPLRLQYKDYAEWQNSAAQKKSLERQEIYWVQRFAGELPVLNLPCDYPRPAVQSFEGRTTDFCLGREETAALRALAAGQDATVYMVLLMICNILLGRLGSQEDIVVGSPTAGRRHSDLEKIVGIFINSLAMRNYPSGEKDVQSFLGEVKENALEAFENQDYPFEDLVEKVAAVRDIGRNPVFDVLFSLQNLGEPQLENFETQSPGQDSPSEDGRGTAKFDISIFAIENEETIDFSLEYCTRLFKPETAQRFTRYFLAALSAVIANPAAKILQIDILSDEERNEILYDFNDSTVEFTNTRTIPELFLEQVEKQPDAVALLDTGASHLSYRELNKQSNRLAHLLRQKGVVPDTTAAVLVERSPEMVVAVYAVLKAGAAYLPIDPGYPEERVRYMLEDSGSRLLLTEKKFIVNLDDTEFDRDIIDVRSPGLDTLDETNLGRVNKMQDLVYMIYTSGSTGKPKGVMVKIESFMNLLYWYIHEFDLDSRDCMLLIAPASFDLTQKNFFAPLLAGGTLCLSSPGVPDYDELLFAVAREQVTMLNCAPSVFYPLPALHSPVDYIKLRSLRHVFLGGEPILREKLVDWTTSEWCRCEIVNTYGPTECTDIASSYRLSREDIVGSRAIPIGKPVYNAGLFVLDGYGGVLPVGVVGELCIGGVGVSRGYHKNPQLTAEKFVETPHLPVETVYRTGDMVKWLPGGDIEFLGRVDLQVKVRGNRIELGEIESRLLKHPGVKEAVVNAIANKSGDNYLCAYMIEAEPGETPGMKELRDYLSGELPDYMVPTYFMWLDSIPLTPSGKVNRKALPAPEVSVGDDYTAPTNEIELQLTDLWSVVLGIESDVIGIDADFFALGGHSLKATVLAAKIHKQFDVRMPLIEIFKNATVRSLARYLEDASRESYHAVEAVEEKEYYILSSAQKRLYILQQMEPESTGYNVPRVIPLDTAVDKDLLEETFRKMIRRHESLRTSFIMVNEEPVQRIHENVEFKIDDIIGSPRRGVGTEHRSVPFDLQSAPLMRVGLVKLAEEQYIFMMDMHHIITDGISQEILEKEFMALLAGESLEPLRIRYKDYAEWQSGDVQREYLKRQELYWLGRFAGEPPLLDLPTDYPRPGVQSFEGAYGSFSISREETDALKALAAGENATLYMVLLTVFNLLLAGLAGREDIVVGSPVAGRRHADLEKIIGMFVNTLAMRNYPSGEKNVKSFLREVKESTLAAFENQDYPFEDLVEKVSVVRDAARNPIFDVMFTLQNMGEGQAVRAEPGDTVEGLSDDHGTGIVKFDIALFAVETGDSIAFSVEYCTKLFKEDTIRRFIGYFKTILSAVCKNPSQRISGIEMMTEAEKRQILVEFNQTASSYPRDKTIHQLFERQVERTPDAVALTHMTHRSYMSYDLLNRRSNHLADFLMEKGVAPGDIVGLMSNRSIEMIIGILGILKAGAAYLPIDPDFPQDRIDYMSADSNAKIVLRGDLQRESAPNIPHPAPRNSQLATSLAYIIYTSGSTGKPKGVLVEH